MASTAALTEPYAVEQDVTGLARKPHVGDHQVETLWALLLGFRNASYGDQLVPIPLENALDLCADDPLILDQKDLRHR